MGDSTGQRADGFHFLGLLELLLESFFFFFCLFQLGDIMGHDHRPLCVTIFVVDKSCINQNPELVAIFCFGFIFDTAGQLLALTQLIHPIEHLYLAFFRQKIQRTHVEELIFGITGIFAHHVIRAD